MNMDRIRLALVVASGAALVGGLAYVGLATVLAVLSLNGTQVFVLAAGGIGGGASGLMLARGE